MAEITEWTFAGDVASWIDELLRDNLALPFSRARVEVRGRGSQKRRDLTIYDRNEKIALTGELKLPDNPAGRSPFEEGLVLDAHDKADRVGAEYFFTWNVNRCVLWKTFQPGKPITERQIEHFYVFPSPIRQGDELSHPRVQEQIKQFLARFLARCAAIITGAEAMLWLPLDEKFIYIWEAALDPLVADTLRAINEKYNSNKAFRYELNKWMRDDQGWTLSNEEAVLRDNLERAAKFSCYVFANKLIFYKALRRRFPRIKVLRIAKSIETGEQLKQLLDEFFDHAISISRDYQTVFRGDFGDTLPVLNDSTVDAWRSLITQTDPFDFTQISYEVIGQIFEGMLSTSERHKYGQHYTRSEVVDLINAFCIQEPDATVLDPACGGGTFLVRAYQRKRDLSDGTLTHDRIINQLYGIDISAYPAHLTTINLATRDLIERANYPFVVRKDFFRVNPGDQVFHVPLGGGLQATWSEIPKVDVVVGNPPYVRHEKINEYYGPAYKRFLQGLASKESPTVTLSGRSDILCYFFTHGLSFLDDDGHMGLLTSSTWLDTAYGFGLQRFLLDNFEINAIFESNCEPWFIGARVTTAATILHRQKDVAKREANSTKFVWLKKPLSEFLTYAVTEEDRRLTFEELRNRIERLTADEETESWRVRIVNQGELYRLGCLPFTINEDEEGEGDEESEEAEDDSIGPTSAQHVQANLPEHQGGSAGDYTGHKWGIFLRAPEVFFKLLRRSDAFVPFKEIADVKFGLKSGCDKFFFPQDITDNALKTMDDSELIERYGFRRLDVKNLRLMRAGDGSVHTIEAKYLEPEIHGLMDIQSVSLQRKHLNHSVVLIPTDVSRADKHARLYVEWGESEDYHTGRTCQGRISENRDWHDLTGRPRGEIIWPKLQQYRHVVAYNPDKLTCNCNLYDVFVNEGVDTLSFCAVLNSTVVALMKFLFGSQMGREGNQVTEIFDVKMMLVPNPQEATREVRKRLRAAIASMRKREALQLVDVDSDETGWTGELALGDRQELDDATLELLGIADSEERKALRAELYDEITILYRQIRKAERIMQRYRSMTARAGRPTANSLADEIWQDLNPRPEYKTPLDFVPARARCEGIEMPLGRARITKGNLFQPDSVQIGEKTIVLRDPTSCEFVKALADLGINGEVNIPIDSKASRVALTEYRSYKERLTEEFLVLASAFTIDENMQERVVRELWKKASKVHLSHESGVTSDTA